MKKIKVKRLVYYAPASGDTFFGGEEYDGHLTDDNILGAIYEVGKNVWHNGNLWVIRGNDLIYKITVEEFTQYTKSKLDLFLDALRRI